MKIAILAVLIIRIHNIPEEKASTDRTLTTHLSIPINSPGLRSLSLVINNPGSLLLSQGLLIHRLGLSSQRIQVRVVVITVE